MLAGLLPDCRVADVRLLGGVHADRVAGTGAAAAVQAGDDALGAEPRLH